HIDENSLARNFERGGFAQPLDVIEHIQRVGLDQLDVLGFVVCHDGPPLLADDEGLCGDILENIIAYPANIRVLDRVRCLLSIHFAVGVSGGAIVAGKVLSSSVSSLNTNSPSAADGERAEQQVMMSPMKEPPAEP